MFCSNCGKELSETAAFCGGCGRKVGGASVPFTPSTQQEYSFLNKKIPILHVYRVGRPYNETLTISTSELRLGVRMFGFIPLSRKLDALISYQDIERVECGTRFGTVSAIILYTAYDTYQFRFNKCDYEKIPSIVAFINAKL